MSSPIANNGFTDLRVGHGAGGIGDDSVWPSFTDIMTVIVMIFLMALVIMIVRNSELDRQLVTTEISLDAGLAENRGLQNQLRISQAERDALQVQLLEQLQRIELMLADNTSLEEQLSVIITERDRLSKEKQQQAALSAQRIAALALQFDDLKRRSAGEIKTLSTANLSLTRKLDETGAKLEQVTTLLRTEQAQSTERYAAAQAEIDRLNEAIQRRQLENAALQKLADASGINFRSLQEEYESLDAKYRELVRPARSPAGKYVVDVLILKTGDQHHFRLQEPGKDAMDYSKAELYEQLAALKDAQGRNLYTKIIIPENNAMSHGEAWRFTEEILQGYDYYYQDIN